MSNPPTPPTPPPIPPQQPPPIRVMPLGYGPTPTYTRPGILTAVAVISIIVASFGILFSGATGLYGVLMSVASGFSQTTTVTTNATATVGTTTTTAPTANDQTEEAPTATADEDATNTDRMPKANRQVVVDALAGLRPLSDTRQKHLDALLAQTGKKILPLSGDALTRRAVQANVTDAGRYPSGTGKASAGADFFAVALGRIEIDDRHAVFYPLGAGEVVRASASEQDADASAGTSDESAGTSPTPPQYGAPLTEAEVKQVIATVERQAGQKLNAAQAASLRAQLKTPGQTLFVPNVPAAAQVGAAFYSTNKAAGTTVVTFVTANGSMALQSNGTVTTTGGFPGGRPAIPNVMRQSVLVIVSSALSFALAVLLLIAGIATTRNARNARRLHLIYACLKLPVGLAAMAAWGWLWYAFMSGLPTAGVTPVRSVSIIFSAPIVLGLIYPLALLIVMNTRTVKAYYSPAASR